MASIIQKKRLINEVKLLAKEPLHYCVSYPDESNPLIWYFLIKGQRGTDYHTGTKNSEGKFVGGDGGEYIGKIVHSPKYPVEPPDYYMLTPSGRYSVGTKICLTNSSYHKGDWSSTWNIITILIAFYSIWLDDKEHGISHIMDTPANRKRMASESIAYNLKNNRAIYDKFNRTYLKDDIPIVLKNKVVSDEEQSQQAQQTQQEQQTQQAEQAQQEQPAQQAEQAQQVEHVQVVEEMKEANIQQNNQIKAKAKAKRGRKPKVAK